MSCMASKLHESEMKRSILDRDISYETQHDKTASAETAYKSNVADSK